MEVHFAEVPGLLLLFVPVCVASNKAMDTFANESLKSIIIGNLELEFLLVYFH